MEDICRVDVFVRNMEHFDQIHKVRREYFKLPAPASNDRTPLPAAVEACFIAKDANGQALA